MKKACVFSTLLVATLLLTYESVAAAPLQPHSGAVAGVTKNAVTGDVVSAVQVVLFDAAGNALKTRATDQQGRFSVAGLLPGEYRVIASKEGLSQWSGRVTIQPDQAETLLLSMTDAHAAETAASAQSIANGVSNAEMLAQLEALKQQMQQLEAKLTQNMAKTSNGSTGNPASANPAQADTAVAANVAPQTSPNLQPVPNQTETAGKGQSGATAETLPAAVDTQTPFADADWTWLNGASRQKDYPLDSKYFSGEFRADTFFGVDFNQPRDHSMGGSSEVFRSGEFQLEDLSVGGDFHVGNMRGRVLTLFGMFSSTTPRNDASAAVGQWDARTAYRYISEAYGGYHFNVNHGLNVDAGIFVSYVGLFSYHNFDNWAYQPSYVSSNTPWFFNGLRVQWFPTNHLKIEPWLINGWQSYNKFNGHPGVGGQIRWTPKPWLNILGNQYAVGNDNIGLPHRGRYHTDDSIEAKYFDRPGTGLDKMAFTLTGDMGCETGQGVTCHGGKGGPKQSFLGYMAYNRFWFNRDRFGITVGGGQINNPGRYLVLVLPINGADAISGTPYFPAAPGLPFKAWDATTTFDWMPNQFTTFRMEMGYRHANVPYWSGRGGITPPGGNNGFPGQYACNDGMASVDGTTCGAAGLWRPDLRRGQALLSFAVMVKL